MPKRGYIQKKVQKVLKVKPRKARRPSKNVKSPRRY